MTSQLHPEELLDRERRGTLDADGLAKLDAHSKDCPACAFERRSAGDFSDELRASSDDSDLLDRVFEKALAEPLPSRDRKPPRVLLIAVAAALVAAAAAAAVRFSRPAPTPPPAADEPTLTLPEAPAPKTEPKAAPSPEPEAEAETPEAPKSSATPRVPTAAELFASATRARHDKKDDEAIRLYRDLQRRYPDSREAKASRVVLGQLLLDRTDPNQALGEFDRYLDGGAKGTVTEEALVGRATALQKLGKKSEERAAWQELLVKFPNSVHAARAKQRIAATAP
jgi:TolA-binding protein